MHVPVTLSEWNLDAVVDLSRLGKCEGERFDFKANLPDGNNLSKICCAFANSQGGFIVVGVKERARGHFLVEGIEPDGEIAKKFGDKLKAVPTIDFSTPLLIKLIQDPRKVLYIFEIPASSRRPHVPLDLDKSFFWKRTPAGCEQMSYNEIQEQFIRANERREKLKLLFIELMINRDALIQLASTPEGQYSLITLDSNVMDRLLVDTYSVVQEQPELVRVLLCLRNQLTVIRNKTQIFFLQMAMPLSNNGVIVAEQNSFMKQKAEFLLPLIIQALELLTKEFHLQDPLASSTNSA